MSPPDSAAEDDVVGQAQTHDEARAKAQSNLTDARRIVERLGAEQVLETHISWVLLVGDLAYKIKKPVSLGFLDFSTLDKRRNYCEAELRLNRRFAADLYLAVVPITGDTNVPQIDGPGPVIEYALKMKRFAQDGLFSRLLEDGRLTPALVDELAGMIAALHASAPVCAKQSGYGTVQHQFAPILESLNTIESQIRTLCPEVAQELTPEGLESDVLGRLRDWTEAERRRLVPWLDARLQNGFVRDGHGDLHLGNVALVDGRVTAFDGIEFDEGLRNVDVICDLAFSVMDLQVRGRTDLAWRLVDGYLTQTGDFDGLDGLRLYVLYRALVRAKVALMRVSPRSGAARTGAREETRFVDDARRHLLLAYQQTRTPSRFLAICSGLSGSGKTRIAQILLEQCPAIRVRSDVERKRLVGLDPLARSASRPNADLYAESATASTYERLACCAAQILDAGFPVIVDATFLRAQDRQRYRQIAERQSVPFHLIDVRADEPTLRRRVRVRGACGTDASEADLAVLELQMRTRQPLNAEELDECIAVDNSADGDDDWLRKLCAPVIGRLLTPSARPGPAGTR